MYIHVDEVSEAVHRYLVERCRKTFSFALQVLIVAVHFVLFFFFFFNVSMLAEITVFLCGICLKVNDNNNYCNDDDNKLIINCYCCE